MIESGKKIVGPLIGLVSTFVVFFIVNISIPDRVLVQLGGCSYSRSVCVLEPKIWQLITVVLLIFCIFYFSQLIKGESKHFKAWSWSYASIMLILLAIFSSINTGLLTRVIGGTAFECSLFGTGIDRDECYSDLAKAKNEIAYCNMIPTEQQVIRDCHTYFAEKQIDIKLCVNNDIYCQISVARKSKDPKLCSEIKIEYEKAVCLDYIAQDSKGYLK